MKINKLKEKMLAFCSEKGIRKTQALISIIDAILLLKKPTSLENIYQNPKICGICDKATAFRILKKLENLGLIKRYWFNSRRSYYFLYNPNKHNDFLICQNCEIIEIINENCPFENNKELKKFEKKVAQQSGFKKLHHELGFFGLCASCQ